MVHVLDPKEIAKRRAKHQRAKRRNSRNLAFVAALILVVLCCGAYQLVRNTLKPAVNDTALETPASDTPQAVEQQPQTPKTTLKTFTGVQFRDLYRSINYPNTQPFIAPPEITGNTAADDRIRSLAAKRGFVLTSIPVAPIEKTGEQMLNGDEDDLLQPLALKAWLALKEAANKEGLKISLISAYRSPKWQRELFTDRLYSTGITASQIAAGTGDNAVNNTLGLTAVPGYSRHHTGYTIDLYCEDGVAFGASRCNTWISKNNYENAKKHGWIPSYPPDAGEQGPEPEPWEYVWVGTDVLYE